MSNKLFEILLKSKLITPGHIRQCEEYLANATSPAKSIDAVLGLGLIADKAIAKALSKSLNIPYVKIKGERIPPEVVGTLTAPKARQYKVMPLKIATNKKGQKVLFLAMGDATDEDLVSQISIATRLKIKPVATPFSHILWSLEAHFGRAPEVAAGPAPQMGAAPAPIVAPPTPAAYPISPQTASPPEPIPQAAKPSTELFEEKRSLFESLTLEEVEEDESKEEEEKTEEKVPEKKKRLTLADRRREIREREQKREEQKEKETEEEKPTPEVAKEPVQEASKAPEGGGEKVSAGKLTEKIFDDLPMAEVSLEESKPAASPEPEISPEPKQIPIEKPVVPPQQQVPQIPVEDMPTIIHPEATHLEDTVSEAESVTPEAKPAEPVKASEDIKTIIRTEAEPLHRELSRLSEKLSAIIRLLIKKGLLNPRDIDEEMK